MNIAKDINNDELPKQMFKDGILLDNENLQEEFSNFFNTQIQNLVSTTQIDEEVFNGSAKVQSREINFMTEINILKAVGLIKLKTLKAMTESHRES